ncbi:MAG: methyltransferase domain-containing protein [Pseudomonadota bacterium]
MIPDRHSIDPIRQWNELVAASPAYLRTINGEDEVFWEQCADSYMQNRTSGNHYTRVTRWLQERIPAEASLIEIGPGPGVFTGFLADRCARVTAIEPSPANSARLMREMSDRTNLEVKKEKWEDVAVAPLDVVFSAGTLYVFPDIEMALKKMLRHAEWKVLLVSMTDEQPLQHELAAALGLPTPVQSGLSTELFIEVLSRLNLSFVCDRFTDEQAYVYPNIDVLMELWQGSLPLQPEHRPALEAFFRKSGFYGEKESRIEMKRRFSTTMVDISAGGSRGCQSGSLSPSGQ